MYLPVFPTPGPPNTTILAPENLRTDIAATRGQGWEIGNKLTDTNLFLKDSRNIYAFAFKTVGGTPTWASFDIINIQDSGMLAVREYRPRLDVTYYIRAFCLVSMKQNCSEGKSCKKLSNFIWNIYVCRCQSNKLPRTHARFFPHPTYMHNTISLKINECNSDWMIEPCGISWLKNLLSR